MCTTVQTQQAITLKQQQAQAQNKMRVGRMLTPVKQPGLIFQQETKAEMSSQVCTCVYRRLWLELFILAGCPTLYGTVI